MSFRRGGRATRDGARRFGLGGGHVLRKCRAARAAGRVEFPHRIELKIGPVRYTRLDLLLNLIKVPASNSKNSLSVSLSGATTRFRFFFWGNMFEHHVGVHPFSLKKAGVYENDFKPRGPRRAGSQRYRPGFGRCKSEYAI